MNIKNFKEVLPYLFKAEVTPFVWGHSGIGKTTIAKAIAKELNYKFFALYLGTQSDLGDILGLADFVRDKNGTAIATTFATPIWLKKTIDYCEEHPESGAIIFLDEFNRARRDVLQGMFSLALDKTFHTIKLPKNCYIIAAGNPPTDEYQVTDVNDTALMARFAHIKLDPTVEEWVQFATNKEYNTDLVNFVRQQPELLEDARMDFQLPVKVDRRSYERVNRLMEVGTPDDLLIQLMQGILGLERVVAYQKFLSSAEKPLSGDNILCGIGLDLLNKWTEGSDMKTSLLSATNDNLIKYFKERKDNLLEKEKEHLLTYLHIVPKELAYVFVRDMLNEGNELFKHLIKTDRKAHDKMRDLVVQAKGKDES